MNQSQYTIVTGKELDFKQEYAAQELHRYLYRLTGQDAKITEELELGSELSFLLGTQCNNSAISEMSVSVEGLGDEGYLIKTYGEDCELVVISAEASQGILYGVYGLLDDYYGVGFYLSGDAIPQKKTKLPKLQIDERKTPKEYIRGILPWTNFPQSATVYSIQDWIFIIDQMTRMRMNFLNLHNYNGQKGYGEWSRAHNEIFHNIMLHGTVSKVWNSTASVPHSWQGIGFDVNDYLFGGTDFFGDYDFGADATMHNEWMDNIGIFKKGVSELQSVIQYAHHKGVKIGLGIDLDLTVSDYGYSADDTELVTARANQLATDYPELDYLLLYHSECCNDLNLWQNAFNIFYPIIRKRAPKIKLAVSGWGLSPDTIKNLPIDVIAAPISPHGKNDEVLDGSAFGEREYWGCPWMERDYDDSMYFATYKMKLGKTISTYQERSQNQKGLVTLTWRLTDAVEPKISYIAKASWDLQNRYSSTSAVYGEYATKCFGSRHAEQIDAIIDDNEAVGSYFAECQITPDFTGKDRSDDVHLADSQIRELDSIIEDTIDAGNRQRLNKLRARLSAVRAFAVLDQNFKGITWDQLPCEFDSLVQGFTERIDDISSLGNLTSIEGRLVKYHLLKKEEELSLQQAVKAPSYPVAKKIHGGAVLTWRNRENNVDSFNVYRNSVRINSLAITETSYTDYYQGEAVYRVSAVSEGRESLPSLPSARLSSKNDNSPPKVFVISPPTMVTVGQAADIKAIIYDDTEYSCLSATLHYKAIGSDIWETIPMQRRTKATFGIRLEANQMSSNGMEYYIAGFNGVNTGFYPITAPALTATFSLIGIGGGKSKLSAPEIIEESKNGWISWKACHENVHWYKIYRGDCSDFSVGPQSFVTYVYRDTLSFRDTEKSFDGTPLLGSSFYKITAVDINLNESGPGLPITCDYKYGEANRFSDADAVIKACSMDGAELVTGSPTVKMIRSGDCIRFDNVKFCGENMISIQYSACNSEIGNIIEVWIDGKDSKSGGTCLSTISLPSTGNLEQFDQINSPIHMTKGIHTVYFKCKGGRQYLYHLKSFEFNQSGLVITTDEDSFCANSEKPELKLFANAKVSWSVRGADGGDTALAKIDANGLLTYYENGCIIAVATSLDDNKLVGERSIVLG